MGAGAGPIAEAGEAEVEEGRRSPADDGPPVAEVGQQKPEVFVLIREPLRAHYSFLTNVRGYTCNKWFYPVDKQETLMCLKILGCLIGKSY